MARAKNGAANASMVAGMGGYGCMTYNATGAATEIVPKAPERHFAVIQALEDTTIETVKAAWDAPTELDGVTISAGSCIFVKAASVTITAGYGILYYGYGAVEAAETQEASG